jgi:hypothetical protein
MSVWRTEVCTNYGSIFADITKQHTEARRADFCLITPYLSMCQGLTFRLESNCRARSWFGTIKQSRDDEQTTPLYPKHILYDCIKHCSLFLGASGWLI